MLEKYFFEVYSKFKLNFYGKVFSRFETREASLTAVETFCAEIIHAMNNPTVNEFAKFVNISPPNATHRIQSLIKKGYIKKIQSTTDKREYTLSVTDKYFQYYNVSADYIAEVLRRVRERFNDVEIAQVTRFFEIMDKELMPEVQFSVPPHGKNGTWNV